VTANAVAAVSPTAAQQGKDQEMATDNTIHIATDMQPLDVSRVRDPGVQALLLLAVSLGWGIRQKTGQPAVIVAENGIQRRLPTDTSIRISVFQQALSTIMTHTDENILPTIELIDEIIAATKPSTDHQRRLRLALGETPQEHRQRVENSVTPPHRPDPRQEHLMQHIEIPEEKAANEALVEYLEVTNPPYVAADGGDHGDLLSREPLLAKRSQSSSAAQVYVSDTSFERHWADGYVDFECMVCGFAHRSSRGVGSHSQRHQQPEKKGIPAYQRAGVERIHAPEPEPEPTIEWEEPDPGQTATVPAFTEEELSIAQQTLDKVIQLVVPTILRERDNLRLIVDELRHENAELRAVNEKLGRDWGALKELIGGST
jgi:hypothetical protein